MIFVVSIACDHPQSESEAVIRMRKWAQRFGHTTVEYGFEFIEFTKVAPRGIKQRERGA